MAKPTEEEVLSVNERARKEVVSVLDSCKESSEMADEDHVLHGDYEKAIDLVERLLLV